MKNDENSVLYQQYNPLALFWKYCCHFGVNKKPSITHVHMFYHLFKAKILPYIFFPEKLFHPHFEKSNKKTSENLTGITVSWCFGCKKLCYGNQQMLLQSYTATLNKPLGYAALDFLD